LFVKSALPFLLSVGFVVFGPLLDDLTWKSAYRSFYKDNNPSPIPTQHLVDGAAWAVDLAQVVPASLLTIAGALLLFDEVSSPVAVICLLLPIAPLLLVAYVQRRGNVQAPDEDFRLFGIYSLPQVAVGGVNLAAVLLVALHSLT